MKSRGSDYPDLSEEYSLEANRVREVLARRIAESRLSRREIERQSGLSTSTVTKVLNGLLRLNFVHVLVIVDALGLDRGEFFASLYPRRQEPLDTEDLETPSPVSRLRQDLDGMVREEVKRYLREEGAALIREGLESHFKRIVVRGTLADQGSADKVGISQALVSSLGQQQPDKR